MLELPHDYLPPIRGVRYTTIRIGPAHLLAHLRMTALDCAVFLVWRTLFFLSSDIHFVIISLIFFIMICQIFFLLLLSPNHESRVLDDVSSLSASSWASTSRPSNSMLANSTSKELSFFPFAFLSQFFSLFRCLLPKRFLRLWLNITQDPYPDQWYGPDN